MLFAYNEDGTLEVVADLEDARRRFAPVDVESGAISIFDEAGAPLKPVFPRRSSRKFMGIPVGHDAGEYDLVPDDTGAGSTFGSILADANVLMPNWWFSDLAAVRAHIARTNGGAGAANIAHGTSQAHESS